MKSRVNWSFRILEWLCKFQPSCSILGLTLNSRTVRDSFTFAAILGSSATAVQAKFWGSTRTLNALFHKNLILVDSFYDYLCQFSGICWIPVKFIYLFVLFVCLLVCLFVCMFVCLFVLFVSVCCTLAEELFSWITTGKKRNCVPPFWHRHWFPQFWPWVPSGQGSSHLSINNIIVLVRLG